MNPTASKPGFAGTSSEATWIHVVDLIRRGDPKGMQQLYEAFSKGIRFVLFRQLGSQDLDDKVHDVFLIITQAICNGDLREPGRLMGYVRTVVRRQVAAHIENAIEARRNHSDLEGTLFLSDRRPDPERGAIDHEQEQLALRILNSICRRDREVLIRFYLEEQTADQICHAMNLTETQFRLIKSRAKARFGELGKRRFSMRTGFLR